MNHALSFPSASTKVFSNALTVFLGSALLALFSNVSVPLPFTPVPIVFQDSLALFLALLMGKRGFYATALFVFYGCMGLPVFASGAVGFIALAGPTGGYIIGYLVATFLVGYLSDKQKAKTPLAAFLLMSVGSVVVLGLGCLHLSFFVGIKQVLLLGLLPFIPGNFLKTLIASHLTKLCKWSTK